MNYQPSFARGTSAVPDLPLDQLRWVALPPLATGPDSQDHGEGAPVPLLWRGARTSELQRHGAPEPMRMGTVESRPPTPRPEERDSARDEQGEPKPDQPRRRVPDADIIYVGPRPGRIPAPEPVDVRDLAFTPDALAGTQGPSNGRRSLVPVLLALLIFEIVLSGGIYVGKRYAEAQVIVVPATTSERTIIT